MQRAETTAYHRLITYDVNGQTIIRTSNLVGARDRHAYPVSVTKPARARTALAGASAFANRPPVDKVVRTSLSMFRRGRTFTKPDYKSVLLRASSLGVFEVTLVSFEESKKGGRVSPACVEPPPRRPVNFNRGNMCASGYGDYLLQTYEDVFISSAATTCAYCEVCRYLWKMPQWRALNPLRRGRAHPLRHCAAASPAGCHSIVTSFDESGYIASSNLRQLCTGTSSV
ncbi:hypothetical protein EVAR_47428_1 [Eumeta japonica]|uniref:Uncharacterized protein n=1 Tax=Eumeta variegata TaxID=151549 RepID=A0A4C1Y194_EUMVA|nr:hypothetical protein EVAR_47428_1 [Eumeta japonica]